MKIELSNLKDENNINKWEGIIEILHNKHKELILEFKNSKERKNNDDFMDNIDIKKLSSQQAMKYGDKIIEDDNKRIKNIKKIVYEGLTTMKEVNKELKRQNEVIDNTDKDLKDIDYSLKRSSQLIRKLNQY